MASYRYERDIKPEDLIQETPSPLTPAQQRANWWHYHWYYVVLIAAALLAVGYFVWNRVTEVRPDYTVAVVSRTDPDTAFLSQLETQLEALAGDVNGDGKPEVIFTSYTQLKQNAYKGSLYVLDGTGKPLATVALPAPHSSSVKEANGCMAQPTVADVDNDGKLEIVLSTIYSGIVVYDIT